MLKAAIAERGTIASSKQFGTRICALQSIRHMLAEVQTKLFVKEAVRDILVLPIWGGSSAIQKNNIANLMCLRRD